MWLSLVSFIECDHLSTSTTYDYMFEIQILSCQDLALFSSVVE
jgi:hypothetical protein